MAGQRLTDKAVYADNLASDDKLMIVDKSDTTGSADGTSKQVDNKFIIQTDKVAISSANFQGMDSSGGAGTYQTLVAAPGAGFMIQPITVTALVDYTSGTQGTKVALYIAHAISLSHVWSETSGFMKAITSDKTYTLGTFGNGITATTADNLPLLLYSGGNYTSTFSADFYITYKIVKI